MSEFQPVDIAHKEQLKRFLSIYQNEASECTFSNMFIWGEGEQIYWKVEEDALLLHVQPNMKCTCMFMAFAQPDRLGRALDLAVETMEGMGETFQMRCLPKWYCDMMEAARPGRFIFNREPHHDDYIYCVDQLIELGGKAYHSKRNHINRFMSEYQGRYCYEPYTPALADECMQMHLRWFETQMTAPCDPGLKEEVVAVERALEHAKTLGLRGGVIRIGGRVEAFSLGEQITSDMALIHIEKANTAIPGLFTMINRETLIQNFSQLTFVNREEDMGDEGLRRAKQSYRPVNMIEKYGARLAY